MSVNLSKNASKGHEQMLISQEQETKINEVRKLLGSLSDKASLYCSDASISRYLSSRNWNVQKAAQMLKLSLKWREEYKPEEICWEDIADEAATGKMYRSNYNDKHGRTVLVIRPRNQLNTKTIQGQIKYFVYCMENATLNLPPHQEGMVWLIDFQGLSLSNISFKLARETAHVLQEYYPGRLGLAVMYNAPMIFQPFFKMVKPLLDTKTYNKLKFGYSGDRKTKKMMEDLFDIDNLESAFGGKHDIVFDVNKYAERMKEEDKMMAAFWTRAKTGSSIPQQNIPSLDSIKLNADSNSSGMEKIDCSLVPNPGQNLMSN
ncbi:putative CRAL-TRIO lipid binding domain, CRAL/TRIO domain-containing protein [Lupinus albus]|uniref:Putative CRAL-TRIO lipid binding domain, CRAL/TRIO domain-containing protein n=1 Tax=Lupinus albus TaxID=3870 RepID=A0A6A4PQE2_LUPAL|nr:putative CRAL-TRIO lipid binding domain, CRAL/TRIO domain-containing protein [Lupinus albus]